VKSKTNRSARIISSLLRRVPLREAALVLVFAAFSLAFITRPSGGGPPFATPEEEPGDLSRLQIEIFADGEQILLSITPTNTAAALREAGLVLGPLDRVAPGLNKPLWPGEQIHITRVEVITLWEEVSEPHEEIVLADPDLRPGIVVKVREGRDGKLRRQVRVWKKDGVETLRQVISTTRLQEPIEAVEIRGSAGLPSRGGNIRRCLTLQATAYDPGPRSCGKYASGYTSIGLKAGKGVVAVDPRVIALGSRLYVEGYGFALAGDVGGAIKGRRIDLGFNTYREALRFGRRKVKVYVLE